MNQERQKTDAIADAVEIPEGATHYHESNIDLGYSCITYFKKINGKYHEYFSNHFARYETGIDPSQIKPL